MELKAQVQARSSAAVGPPPRIRDTKSLKLPAFIDEKDELDSCLLRFERYAENAKWEKNMWVIMLSALLTGRAMFESRWRCMFFTLVVLYTRIFDGDANDYDNLKKSLLTRSSFTEDGYRNRFREVKPETEETPDQFIIRLKNYLAKWLEFSVNSCGDFDALVDLIVKEQFINVCFERISCVPARERTQGPGRVNYMGSAVPDCT